MGAGRRLQGRARLLEQARRDALRAAREAQKSTPRAQADGNRGSLGIPWALAWRTP